MDIIRLILIPGIKKANHFVQSRQRAYRYMHYATFIKKKLILFSYQVNK